MPSALARRTKNIQRKLNVQVTGMFDSGTCGALENVLGLNTDSAEDLKNRIKAIQSKLGFENDDIDGIVGVKTISRIETYLLKLLPARPPGASLICTERGLDEIIKFEVSSEQVYQRKYSTPIWPGGSSGITIGIGYDLGYNSAAKIKSDWSMLDAESLNFLSTVSGLKGNAARNRLQGDLKMVTINYALAKEVFYTISLPQFARAVLRVYPGAELLPADAQSMLLSLIYNRGARLSGSSRTEMKNIVALVRAQNLHSIASEIRNMKRLWIHAGLPGLLARRDREAEILENASYVQVGSDFIFV